MPENLPSTGLHHRRSKQAQQKTLAEEIEDRYTSLDEEIQPVNPPDCEDEAPTTLKMAVSDRWDSLFFVLASVAKNYTAIENWLSELRK